MSTASGKGLEMEYLMKVRQISKHSCKLQLQDHPVDFHITEGVLVKLRRWTKRWLVVDYENPESKFVLRSSAMIYVEMHRHLHYYYYMIHPFSKARQYWENLMILVYYGLFLVIPFELSRAIAYGPIKYIKVILDAFSIMDIALNFATGYLDNKVQRVVLNPRRVCNHYLKTHFFFDAISSMPTSAVIHFGHITRIYELKLFMLFKLVRLPTFIRYIKQFCERRNWKFHKKGYLFFLGFAIILSISTSVVFMMIRVKAAKRLGLMADRRVIFTSCFGVLREFMLVGLGKRYYSQRFSDMILAIICLFLGSILNMILLAKFMSLHSKGTSAERKYKDLMQQITEYMKFKELPPRLKYRIKRFVNFKYRKHIFKEADIMKNLSSILKQDLMLNNCKTMIQRVEFFKELPTSAMLRLLSRLKSDIFLTNDVIVQAGVPGHAMYFIYNGTVAVYTMTGKEICHLSEGSHFGEIALIINEPRVATVVAIKECELFRLSRKDFHEALEPYPELAAKIRESAMARLESTMKMMEQEKLDSMMMLPRGSMYSGTDGSTEGSLVIPTFR